MITDFPEIQLSMTLYVMSTMKIIQWSRHCFNHHVIVFLAMTAGSQQDCNIFALELNCTTMIQITDFILSI